MMMVFAATTCLVACLVVTGQRDIDGEVWDLPGGSHLWHGGGLHGIHFWRDSGGGRGRQCAAAAQKKVYAVALSYLYLSKIS